MRASQGPATRSDGSSGSRSYRLVPGTLEPRGQPLPREAARRIAHERDEIRKRKGPQRLGHRPRERRRPPGGGGRGCQRLRRPAVAFRVAEQTRISAREIPRTERLQRMVHDDRIARRGAAGRRRKRAVDRVEQLADAH
jgi:hypothetical protein